MTLDVIFEVSTPSGPLSLNTGPYELAGDSFASHAVQHRRQDVTNPFVEGTYTVNALRENITEPVSVYVRGANHTAMAAALDPLKSAFDQVQFEARRVMDGYEEFWQCFASDYSVSTQKEFLHARMAQFTVQLLRHPGARAWSNQASGFWIARGVTA